MGSVSPPALFFFKSVLVISGLLQTLKNLGTRIWDNTAHPNPSNKQSSDWDGVSSAAQPRKHRSNNTRPSGPRTEAVLPAGAFLQLSLRCGASAEPCVFPVLLPVVWEMSSIMLGELRVCPKQSDPPGSRLHRPGRAHGVCEPLTAQRFPYGQLRVHNRILRPVPHLNPEQLDRDHISAIV